MRLGLCNVAKPLRFKDFGPQLEEKKNGFGQQGARKPTTSLVKKKFGLTRICMSSSGVKAHKA